MSGDRVDQAFNSTNQAMENDNAMVTDMDFDEGSVIGYLRTTQAVENDNEMVTNLDFDNGSMIENLTTTQAMENDNDMVTDLNIDNGSMVGNVTMTQAVKNDDGMEIECYDEIGNMMEDRTRIYLAMESDHDTDTHSVYKNSKTVENCTADPDNIVETENVNDFMDTNTSNRTEMVETNTKDYRKGNKSKVHLSRRVKTYRGCIRRKVKTSCSKNENDISTASKSDASFDTTKLLKKDKCQPNSNIKTGEHKIEGQRIVEIQYFIDTLKEIGNHNKAMGCTLDNMIIKKEISRGLQSEIFFECNMCKKTLSVLTNGTANQDSVVGIMSIGSGYSHLAQMTSAMNMPCMSVNTYQKIQDKVCGSWESSAIDAMSEAGKEERNLAIERGDLAEDGTPYITVVCDGSWAKRSYRKNYNSLSGAAAIVGYHTRKVLYLGVKNKFCYVCKTSEKKDTIPQHVCHKNFTGSSSSMESAIISEGFHTSIETHGVIYRYMIADGDSSVFKTISDLKPYLKHSIKVEKIECKNHLLRNYRNKIKDLLESTKLPLCLRKKIKGYHMKFSGAINKAIEYRKKENCTITEKIEGLRSDIMNSASHILGQHKKCQQLKYFCSKPPTSQSEDTLMSDLKLTSAYENLMNIVLNMSKNAPSLIHDVNNNMVEQFNAIIAKYIGGKRINYCTRRSYQARCSAATVSFNTKRPLYHVTKKLIHKSPGSYCKKWEIRQKSRIARENLRRKKIKRKLFTGPDKNYGENCAKPDLSPEEYEAAKEMFFTLNLKKTFEEINSIEIRTRGQTTSDVWYLERKKRITASKFYEVCTKKASTSRKKLVESIVNPKPIRSKAIQHGKIFESIAKKAFEKDLDVDVDNCGLFIDPEHQYLAATPDGVLNNDTVIEIKCPYSAREMTPDEGIKNKKITFWKKDMSINKNHKWYFQLQGQLHITKRKYCVLVVWTPLGLKYEKIAVDAEFYDRRMKKQLEDFYFNHLLPELVDSRLERNLQIRDNVTQ